MKRQTILSANDTDITRVNGVSDPLPRSADPVNETASERCSAFSGMPSQWRRAQTASDKGSSTSSKKRSRSASSDNNSKPMLVIDLDHTLVHSSNDPRLITYFSQPEHADKVINLTHLCHHHHHHDKLNHNPPHPPIRPDRVPTDDARPALLCFASGERFLVKTRPGIGDFLSQAAAMFELHLYTHSTAEYARLILAVLLDPDGAIFGGGPSNIGEREVRTGASARGVARVLSRDDFPGPKRLRNLRCYQQRNVSGRKRRVDETVQVDDDTTGDGQGCTDARKVSNGCEDGGDAGCADGSGESGGRGSAGSGNGGGSDGDDDEDGDDEEDEDDLYNDDALVIDDNKDVWEGSPPLLPVTPYFYFLGFTECETMVTSPFKSPRLGPAAAPRSIQAIPQAPSLWRTGELCATTEGEGLTRAQRSFVRPLRLRGPFGGNGGRRPMEQASGDEMLCDDGRSRLLDAMSSSVGAQPNDQRGSCDDGNGRHWSCDRIGSRVGDDASSSVVGRHSDSPSPLLRSETSYPHRRSRFTPPATPPRPLPPPAPPNSQLLAMVGSPFGELDASGEGGLAPPPHNVGCEWGYHYGAGSSADSSPFSSPTSTPTTSPSPSPSPSPSSSHSSLLPPSMPMPPSALHRPFDSHATTSQPYHHLIATTTATPLSAPMPSLLNNTESATSSQRVSNMRATVPSSVPPPLLGHLTLLDNSPPACPSPSSSTSASSPQAFSARQRQPSSTSASGRSGAPASRADDRVRSIAIAEISSSPPTNANTDTCVAGGSSRTRPITSPPTPERLIDRFLASSADTSASLIYLLPILRDVRRRWLEARNHESGLSGAKVGRRKADTHTARPLPIPTSSVSPIRAKASMRTGTGEAKPPFPLPTAHMHYALTMVKSSVLRGVVLAFSGVFSAAAGPPESTRLWTEAEAYGARCVHAVSAECTHLVAGGRRTAKVRSARKRCTVQLVSPTWLEACIAGWTHADEKQFPVRLLPPTALSRRRSMKRQRQAE